jgi:hypothetical protein
MKNIKKIDDFLDENYLGKKEHIINKSALGRAIASYKSNIERIELPVDANEYKGMYVNAPDLKKLKGFVRIDPLDINPNIKQYLDIDILDKFYVRYLDRIPTYSKFQSERLKGEPIFATALYYGWKQSDILPDDIEKLLGIFYIILVVEKENKKLGYQFFYTTQREKEMYYVMSDILDEIEKYEYQAIEEIDPLSATNGKLDDNSNHFH